MVGVENRENHEAYRQRGSYYYYYFFSLVLMHLQIMRNLGIQYSMQ